MRTHRVRVAPLPRWLDVGRLLGDGEWQLSTSGDSLEAVAELSSTEAADLEARLRGVAFAGQHVVCESAPRLPRPLVRKARLDEARRHRQRSAGFSRPGAIVDEETRVGLTPEQLALALGHRAKEAIDARAEGAKTPVPHVVIDACCGAGGNAIGFARAGLRVIAFEIDPTRVEAARNNARVYGVSDRIEIVRGDARMHLAAHPAALWFIDVPWSLRSSDGRLPLLEELLALRPEGQLVWAKVPPDFDPALAQSARAEAWFGAGAGDQRRVKFVLLEHA